MTSVGTSMRTRSLRKSSCHVGTQARLAVADAPAATFQLAWTACSLMRFPRKTSTEEILEKLGEESIAVRSHGFLDSLEDTAIHALGVVTCFQQIGWNASDDHRLAHSLRSVLADVARHFAATHRKADQREVAQLEVCNELVQVLCE